MLRLCSFFISFLDFPFSKCVNWRGSLYSTFTPHQHTKTIACSFITVFLIFFPLRRQSNVLMPLLVGTSRRLGCVQTRRRPNVSRWRQALFHQNLSNSTWWSVLWCVEMFIEIELLLVLIPAQFWLSGSDFLLRYNNKINRDWSDWTKLPSEVIAEVVSAWHQFD